MSDDVLASDAERDAAAAELRQHLAEGRLTTDEFGERLDTVYAARTRADVQRALERLPERVAPPAPPTSVGALAGRLAIQSAIPFLVCTLVWAFTGTDGDFWPKWVLLAAAIAFVTRIGKAASGDHDARAELERRFGRR